MFSLLRQNYWILLALTIGFSAWAQISNSPSPNAPRAWKADNFRPLSKAELKRKLSELQYKVTQEEATEPPFKNEFHDNKTAGIYVDIVSGAPLFSSKDKYDSGTGWPSFTKPINEGVVAFKEDFSWLGKRIEVRSKLADIHLGHVFDDGPAPTGKRYCMNSAAMRFIPKDQMVKEGYADYLKFVD